MVRRLVIAAALTGAYAGFVLWWDPFASHSIGCPFHAVTGLWCPGCGSTRASYELLHGRVLDALQYNLLLPIAAVAIGYCLVRGSTGIPARVLRAGAALVVAFAVARNLPPFGFLAP